MVSFGPNSSGQNFLRNLLRPSLAALEVQVEGGLPAVLVETLLTESVLLQRGGFPQAFAGSQTLMTPQETAIFLKTLFKLPTEIQALLVLLSTSSEQLKPDSVKALLDLLPEQLLPLEVVQALLTQKSQEGVQKLMKYMQGQAVSMAKEQPNFGEMVQRLQQINTQAQASPLHALTTLILLYLPWYPLVPPQQLTLTFADPAEGEGGEGGDETAFHLVLFLETNVLGKFKVSIGLMQRTQLVIKVEHDALAKPHLGDLEKRLQETATQDGIPPPVFLYEERANVPPQATHLSLEAEAGSLLTDKKKVAIQPVTGVPVLVVYMAHTLAREVFELDDRLNLFQHRAKQV